MSSPSLSFTCLLVLLLASCSDAPVTLTVDVLSDWQPGLDFTTVESSVLRDGTAEVRQESFAVTGAEDFIEGVRVAEIGDVGMGPVGLRVVLRASSGAAIASRLVSLDLERSYAATVSLTRSCRDVECPAPMGAPELSECQGGSCVDSRCSPATPEFCPAPQCDTDAECGVRIAWCTTGTVCRSGYCFCSPTGVPIPDTGPPPECGTDAGCGSPTFGGWSDCEGFADLCAESGGTRTREVMTPTCMDGECMDVPSVETESCVRDTDGTACDDADACTSPDACVDGSCTGPTLPCDDSNPCTADSCNASTGCVFAPMAEHSVCGASYQRCCGGACVDTRSSTSHCGGCGINCASGFSCVRYSGRTVCECTANTHCPGGVDHICSPTYDLHCGCRNSSVCPGPMTCVDVAGALNYCTY